MEKNIFVIGRDHLNLEKLKSLEGVEHCRFHPVLEFEEVQGEEAYPVEAILNRAGHEVESFTGSVDAIVSLWDFPVGCLLPILCGRFNLTTPSLKSVITCHHKYWSRVEQHKAVPQSTPRFCKVDPFDDNALSDIDIDFPFWLKPVKAFRSQLGFKVSDEGGFNDSIAIVRDKISRFAKPFDFFLERVCMPDDVAGVDGRFCIAEEIISGSQHALEGYVYRGQACVYGMIDSVKDKGRNPFSRFQYPSTLPQGIQQRAGEIAKAAIRAIGLDNSAFNIEFFYDEDQDRVYLLEINPRISLSNSDLFEKVDGRPNQKIMVDLALGQKPDFPHRLGRFKFAAKFMLRKYEDAVVTKIPDVKDLKKIREQIPGTLIELEVEEGDRLSELGDQDSYSYELADIFIGGESEQELMNNYERCVDALHFGFSPADR